MKLVVDTNRIISALIKDGLSRKILYSDKFEFFSLKYVTKEIFKYKSLIVRKSKKKEEDVDLLISLLFEKITILEEKTVLKKMSYALEIMKNIDIKDAPILAAALCFENEGIWTEDKHFDRQDLVKVWKTSDLLKFMGS